MNKVTVKAVEGKVITPTSNPEYGYIRVEQNVITFDGGFARNSKRSALVTGRMEDLEAIGAFDGMSLPGKIQVTESLEPFNADYAERDLKKAGDTGVVCSLGGQPIYRKAEFTSNASAEDTLIAHDNQAEIKQAQEALASAGSLDLED